MNVFDRDDINNILLKIKSNKLKPFAKGGDGYLYKVSLNNMNYVMKILKGNNIKEILVTEYVQKIYNKNIIRLYDYFLSTKDFDQNLMIIDEMDGNLEEFMKNILSNKYDLSDEDNDNEMKNMIYQITQGFLSLNKNQIAHLDSKPKNILYKYFPSKITLNYNKRLVETHFLFKISDFGKSQVNDDELKSKDDILTEDEFNRYIKERKDLEELSKILERMIVNKIQYDYDYDYFDKIKDNEFQKYYRNEKSNIKLQLKDYPEKIRRRFLKRSLLYYLLEFNMINMIEIKNKFNYFPNNDVINILNKLTNKDFDIETIF